MSKFSNRENRFKVHLSIPEKIESNQNLYRQQYLQEAIKNQEVINQKITDTIEIINQQLQTNKNEQKIQIEKVATNIHNQKAGQELILANLTSLEAVVIEKLKDMDKEHQELSELISKEEIYKQALLAQLSTQEQTIHKLVNKLTKLENFTHELNVQVQENHHEISSKLEVQDIYHKTVMERIDQQEAIAHKMDRQLNSLKSLIFERIAHLGDKIEAQSKHMIKSFSGLLFKPSKSEIEKPTKDQKTQF